MALALTLAWSESSASAQGACTSSPAAQAQPRLPVQFTVKIAPGQWRTTRSAPAIDVKTADLMTVPPDRYLEIDTVSIKGEQPAGSYLALEVQTYANRDAARHFLLARDAAVEARAIHVRERGPMYGLWTTRVTLGVQLTARSSIEPMAVTMTGTLHDRCRWAQ